MLDQPIPESHYIDISTNGYIDVIIDVHTNMSTNGHINFTKDVVDHADEGIRVSHTDISTDGYVDNAQYEYEYKVIFVDEDMNTHDPFQEPSSENNTMEEPSQVEKPMIFEDAVEASITATSLVNDKV